MDRAYISNIAPGWPPEKQVELLAMSVVGWPVPTYRDQVQRRALEAREPHSLTNRAAMLRPTSRKTVGETIHVASLAVLAWRASDFATVVAILAARGATIQEHHEGHTFDLTVPAERMQAMALFPVSRQRGSRQKGRLVGAKVSADRRNARSKAAADKVADRWGLPGETAISLVAETGFTYHTIVRWLGKWEVARRKRERNAKRAAAKLQEQANA